MSPQIYQIRDDKRKKWLMPVLLLIVVLLVAAIIFYFVTQNRHKIEPLPFPFPADDNMIQVDITAYENQATALENRIHVLLASEADTLWYDWYQLEGRLGEPPAEKSETVLLYDQLIYGQYLLEQREEKAFTAWWQQMRTLFLDEDLKLKLTANWQNADVQTMEGGAANWQEAFWLLRILGQSNALWPAQSSLDAFRTISDQLLSVLNQHGFTGDSEVAVPTPAPTPDPAATPIPVPDEPEDPELQPKQTVLSLAGLDLFTLRSLADLDQAWTPYYEEALTLVKNGYITDALPLYALAFEPDTASYLYFSGQQQQAVPVESALQTMLHLAEIDQLPAASLAWLREEIFNRGALYSAYHITQGFPVSDQEAIRGYALAAQIARQTGDQNLYDRAINRLLWHRATSDTSAALGAVFEQDHEGLIRVYADQNLWTLRVLR